MLDEIYLRSICDLHSKYTLAGKLFYYPKRLNKITPTLHAHI